ncbi:hypothetical protein [Arthrobacter antibioticus]|uniref:hypothetical protein n=1 Tax=Arthrobacter sp. H35-MC1 TaxID=3046203 RepID=UPI0024BB1657|nr:hypothetical protein [Arthrobacter sp. H35-MC1]MDJ0318597.1 hypothetical protein [Arthrobacter sp. H35-MC1]
MLSVDSIRENIARDLVPLYGAVAEAESPYFYPPDLLEAHLKSRLLGSREFANLAVRTRSKRAKERICDLLGYRIPKSFQKTQPRLQHPNIDVYVQKSNNLQVWNEELDASRRYVIIGLDMDETVSGLKVIAGADLVAFDTTGTLTKKFQASRRINSGSKLVNEADTAAFTNLLGICRESELLSGISPVAMPADGKTLTIEAVHEALLPIVGMTFTDPGMIQERNRGAVIHREACLRLGLSGYADHGQFPDILSQVLEVKLQLARTVDLGLELPSALTPIASLEGKLTAADVRYSLFYGERDPDGLTFTITALVTTSGARFFDEFQQFGGNVSNSKLQLRLPSDFFLN